MTRTAFNFMSPGDTRVSQGLNDLGSVVAHNMRAQQSYGQAHALDGLRAQQMIHSMRLQDAAAARSASQQQYVRDKYEQERQLKAQQAAELEGRGRAVSDMFTRRGIAEQIKNGNIPSYYAERGTPYSNDMSPHTDVTVTTPEQQADDIGTLMHNTIVGETVKDPAKLAKFLTLGDSAFRDQNGGTLNNDALFGIEKVAGLNSSPGITLQDRGQLAKDKSISDIIAAATKGTDNNPATLTTQRGIDAINSGELPASPAAQEQDDGSALSSLMSMFGGGDDTAAVGGTGDEAYGPETLADVFPAALDSAPADDMPDVGAAAQQAVAPQEDAPANKVLLSGGQDQIKSIYEALPKGSVYTFKGMHFVKQGDGNDTPYEGE